MKKIGTLFVMTCLMLSMISFVVAEDNETVIPAIEEPQEAGVAPGSAFYGLDRAMDSLRLGFTFNKERKAEKALNIAEERLAEAEKLTEIGKIKQAERARAQYDKYLGHAEKAVEKIEANGNKDNAKKSIRSIARIEDKFAEHESKIAERKAVFLEKYGENMTEAQLIEIEALFEKIEVRSIELRNKALEKAEKTQTKYKVLAELSDEELEAFLEEIDSEEGLKEAREMRKARDEQRFEREVEVRERNLERARERLENSNMTDEEKTLIEQRIFHQEERLEEFKNHKAELQFKMEEKINELLNSSEENRRDIIAELEEIREEAEERRKEFGERPKEPREKPKEKPEDFEDEAENESESNLE